MTEQSQSCNLRALRELLIAAFDSEELRALVSHDPTLGDLVHRFAPAHPISVMAEEAVSWCNRRGLIPYLVQLVKQERPEKYKLFEPELFITDTEQPGETETTTPVPEILTITSPIYLDLVKVPAGEFLMGSVAARDRFTTDGELPPHRVHVPEFHIGQYPVTNSQYATFLEATQSSAPEPWQEDGMPRGKENHPIAWVGWYDARAFCAWLREETGRPFRLPTEAEWEKAARGTDGRIYPWGDEPPDETLCNFYDNVGDTTPIGRYSPQGDSPYGCADMAGNVPEWCQSLHRPYPYRAGDGREDLKTYGERVVRGGSFDGWTGQVRCTIRIQRAPHWWSYPQGFRVVVGPDPSGSSGTAQDML